MITFAGLRDAMPEVFGDFAADDTNVSRIAPLLFALKSVQTESSKLVLDSLGVSKRSLVPEPLDARAVPTASALLNANALALRLLRDLELPRFLFNPVQLDDAHPLSEDDQSYFVWRLPALLNLQFLDARCLTSTGRHWDALAQVSLVFRTAAQLLASSVPGPEALYHFQRAVVALLDLNARSSFAEDELMTRSLALLAQRPPASVVGVRGQVFPFFAAIFYGVLGCPDSAEAPVVLRHFNGSKCVHDWLWPAVCSRQSEQDAGRLILLAEGVLKDHPCSFNKSATLAELREALSTPWPLLDSSPAELRMILNGAAASDFTATGVSQAIAGVIVGGRYVESEVLAKLEEARSSVRQSLLAVTNPIGKALVSEARRILLDHIAVQMDCWYFSHLVAEVAYSLIAIKRFRIKSKRRPSSLLEVVQSLGASAIPTDPYSRTTLTYNPERDAVAIEPSCEEIRHWAFTRPRDADFLWPAL